MKSTKLTWPCELTRPCELQEELMYPTYYIYMGWFDSEGEFIYPTPEQKNDPDILYNHTELLLQGSFSEYNQETLKGEIYKFGYIRLSCEYASPKTLQLTFSPYYVKFEQFVRGLNNFEDALMSGKLYESFDTPYLRKKFPNGIPLPTQISVGIIFHQRGTGRSAQRRVPELTKIVGYNAREVWNYVKQIKENYPPSKYDLEPPKIKR